MAGLCNIQNSCAEIFTVLTIIFMHACSMNIWWYTILYEKSYNLCKIPNMKQTEVQFLSGPIKSLPASFWGNGAVRNNSCAFLISFDNKNSA